MTPRSRFAAVAGLLLALLPGIAAAASASVGGVTVNLDSGAEAPEMASALQVLALLTVLSLAPAILIVLTAFTRIIIVLSMLRLALGMQSTPPNTVLVSLALFLTLFTMMPVVDEMNRVAFTPYTAGEITAMDAAQKALVPLRGFMIRQTREKDMALVMELSGKPRPKTMEEIETTTLIPAFMLSELQTAFQIGFVIFLPFLLIDLISASVLMAMGMIMVPPLTIALPIKVLMFVLIEGWALVAKALVGSFS
jgi:flagellar biosynthetic protein FliP